MNIKVIRKYNLPTRCVGELYIDDKFFCYTLEDVDRGLNKSMSNAEIDRIKINAATATPAGDYRVILSYSIKLKRFLPLLLDVPRGKGVRIHKGSNEKYSSACILIGTGVKKDKTLSGIVEAENKLMSVLKVANEKEPLYISIEREYAL